MTELLKYATSWQAFGAYMGVVALFGFAPAFMLNLLVKIYPKDDPRRAELRGELPNIPYHERPLWVAAQLATVLTDGLPNRAAATWRHRRRLITAVQKFVAVVQLVNSYDWLEPKWLKAGRVSNSGHLWKAGQDAQSDFNRRLTSLLPLPPQSEPAFRLEVQIGKFRRSWLILRRATPPAKVHALRLTKIQTWLSKRATGSRRHVR